MGTNPAPRKFLASLDVLPFPRPREDPARIACACLHCASPLALHQLDPELPDRLVGACERCKRWYLVDLASGGDAGVLVGLPVDEVIRALSRENPDEGISLMGDEPDPGPGPGHKPGK